MRLAPQEVVPVQIFLDVDETLVWTHRSYDQEGFERDMARPGAHYIEFPGLKPDERYVSIRRPHAIEFVRACQELAPTQVLTSGMKAFQETVLKTLDFPPIPVFGREEYRQLPRAKLSILVDDLDILTCGVQDKAVVICPTLKQDEHRRYMQDPDRFMLVQVKSWGVPKMEDRTLLDIPDKIRRVMLKQLEPVVPEF